MFSVYILKSSKLNRFYIGTTDDVQNRIIEHNSMAFKNAFTSRGVPWVLILSIDNLSSDQAYKIERHIKKMKSKKYIESLCLNPNLIDTLTKRFLQ
jgi:putative endonuclease